MRSGVVSLVHQKTGVCAGGGTFRMYAILPDMTRKTLNSRLLINSAATAGPPCTKC